MENVSALLSKLFINLYQLFIDCRSFQSLHQGLSHYIKLGQGNKGFLLQVVIYHKILMRYCFQFRYEVHQFPKAQQLQHSLTVWFIRHLFEYFRGLTIGNYVSGKYSGHAAIYISQNGDGIQVWDQWVGHPVSQRTIRWNGSGISTNGDSFYVIN